jgi:hypothetical protein
MKSEKCKVKGEKSEEGSAPRETRGGCERPAGHPAAHLNFLNFSFFTLHFSLFIS